MGENFGGLIQKGLASWEGGAVQAENEQSRLLFYFNTQ